MREFKIKGQLWREVDAAISPEQRRTKRLEKAQREIQDGVDRILGVLRQVAERGSVMDVSSAAATAVLGLHELAQNLEAALERIERE